MCISIIQFTSDCVSYQETNHYKHDWLKRCEKSLLVLPLLRFLSLPRATWSHRASADFQMNKFVYFKAYSSVVKNSPEASSPVFPPKFASHPMESLVSLLYWIFNHLCLREIKEGILLFKIQVQPSPLWLFSLKCADWLNYIFLASSGFNICKLRRYTIADVNGVFPKVSGGLVWACSFPSCSVQQKALYCFSPVIYPQIDIGSASAEGQLAAIVELLCPDTGYHGTLSSSPSYHLGLEKV